MDVLEGRICVLAALRARRRAFEEVLVRLGMKDESVREILEAAEAQGIPVRRVREAALEARAHARSHGGILAVATPLAPSPCPAALDFALLLDGVDDARNLGYTLRSAEAFGVQAVFLRRRSFDFDGGDVSRASSGAFERLPVVLGDEVPPGLTWVGCEGAARKSLYENDFRSPTLIAIGGEKRGLSATVRDRCTALVSIPTAPGAASLSLTHAAAVVLAEAARQRATPGPGGR
jgi:23S rRNA (guanosine2251-2'-O)-methyltransferase